MYRIALIAPIINAIFILYKDIKKTSEELKKSDVSDIAALNMFRSKFLRYMDDYIKEVGKLRKAIKKAEAKYGNTEIGQLKKKIEELENNKS